MPSTDRLVLTYSRGLPDENVSFEDARSPHFLTIAIYFDLAICRQVLEAFPHSKRRSARQATKGNVSKETATDIPVVIVS